MRSINCKGTPYEIGLQHGEQARKEIQGSLEFYGGLFKRKCLMEWPEVCQNAIKFVPVLETSFPGYMQEIRGIAQGAVVDVESILALNVRTEIAYGMFVDGCTAFSWIAEGEAFLAQNWDWEKEQSPNLVSIHITPSDPLKPTIQMITEGGIIGKIGMNSHGVGVTLNAIKAAGVDFNKLPCHLALRTVLESSSRTEAIAQLEKLGVASSCHILIADKTGTVGMECSANDIIQLKMGDDHESRQDIVTHSNHFVHKHRDTESVMYIPDSVPRLNRIRELLAQSNSKPCVERIEEMLVDEKGYPSSICRAPTEKNTMTSLFSIVMNLGTGSARVKIGRPVAPEAVVELRP